MSKANCTERAFRLCSGCSGRCLPSPGSGLADAIPLCCIVPFCALRNAGATRQNFTRKVQFAALIDTLRKSHSGEVPITFDHSHGGAVGTIHQLAPCEKRGSARQNRGWLCGGYIKGHWATRIDFCLNIQGLG
jgi:hypothetical protein